MYKFLIPIALIFTSCSYFTINAAMCEKIASDPNTVMPQECRNYNKKEADKAFDKNKTETSISDDDLKFKEKK